MSLLSAVPAAVATSKAALYALIACAVCGAAGFGGGVWVGIEWQQGRQAQTDNKALRTDVESLLGAAVELRQRGIDVAQDFRTAQRKLEAIYDEHEQRDTRTRTFFQRQSDALAGLVAANPGIAACRIGDDGVQHWNAAARGAGAAGAAAADRGDAALAVPAGAADAGAGRRGHDPAHVGPSGRAVPQLRKQAGDAGASGGGL